MDPPNHFCPGCGTSLPANPRYPWHFCNDCCNTATDIEGRALVFGNASMSGGLVWRYADAGQETFSEAGSVRALIHGRPVLIMEARFGGVVAQPIPDGPLGQAPDRLIDLTMRHPKVG